VERIEWPSPERCNRTDTEPPFPPGGGNWKLQGHASAAFRAA
jgi:hypothetical protein